MEPNNYFYSPKAVSDVFKGCFALSIALTLFIHPEITKAVLAMLRITQALPLAECLRYEYRVACRLYPRSDLREGVRAVLIDRDNEPRWNPSSIEAVRRRCSPTIVVYELLLTIVPQRYLNMKLTYALLRCHPQIKESWKWTRF